MKPNKNSSSVSKRAPKAAISPARTRKKTFPIVGIGASAGGLEAFTQLLEHLPVDTGMAFVLVQHLDPEHESALPHILGRATSMRVREATQAMEVRPNEVYIMPSNSTMSLSGGRLALTTRERTRAPHLSIDFFFQSLAREQQEGAIGVVFSGSATDGTNGLEAIKAAGGITFAQDKSAKYDSMPRNAIASGCVDYVMAPEAVAQELTRIAHHPYLHGNLPPLPADSITPGDAPTAGLPSATVNGIAKILDLAREQTGVDFSLYKTSTIHRRITRRMVLNRKDSIDEYARFVAKDPKELKALFADMLINVTSFFRDEAAFDALKKIIFPKLIGERRTESLRFWTIGCSSGQEAYSLAMAFMEFTEPLVRAPKLQIFGTDLNEAHLTKARHGLYPKSLAHEISAERLRKFFTEEDGGYRVIKTLREMCIFARQDLLGDPPFSRMDLVSCRNVLIYIEPSAQKRIFPILHYALKPDGCLFLGTSESVGSFTDLFEPRDKKQKIFTRRSMLTPPFSLPRRDRQVLDAKERRVLRPSPPSEGLRTEVQAYHEADRLTVNRFAPPGVLIDAGLNVLQFRGNTDAYLTAPSGKASFHLLKLAREGLMLPLRATINQARKLNETVRREKVRVGDGSTCITNLEVIPLKNLSERYFLVLFEDSAQRNAGTSTTPIPAAPLGRAGDSRLRRRNAELERELRETRDFLQSLQQQHDTAHDELQASNEEVQSTNEELQSINEELETSKEELESGNEELITVNEEMAYRNGELSRVNSDLNNFHVSINTPIVVLGRDLTIRRFTPMAEKLFNLLANDVGRPIAGIKHNLQLNDLEGFVGKVIDLVAVRECEVRDKNGHWYLLRARPYLTVDNKIDGAVLVLLDIDALKRSEQVITQERNYAEATLRTARDPLIILRPDLTVNTANDAFYRAFELTAAQTENRLLFDLAGGAWNIPALRELLADVLPRNHFFNDLEVTHDFGALGQRTMLLNGRRLDSEEGAPLRILLSIEDVTERLRSRAALRASEIRYRRLFEAAKDGVLILDPETRRITDVNPFMTQLLGYRRDEFIGKELFEIGLFRDKEAAKTAFQQLREKQQIRYEHLPLKGKDGASHDVEVVANLYDEDGRSVIQCNVRDITERKRLETALQTSEAYFRDLTESLPCGVWTSQGDGIVDFINHYWLEYTGQTFRHAMAHPEVWQNAIHPDDRAQADAISAAGRAAGKSYAMEVRFRQAASREYRWFLKRSMPVHNAEGSLQKRIGICIDIDDLKRAQSILADHASELAIQVNARTTELRETIGELEAFSYSVSHDMRAPLRAMQGFAQLVLSNNEATLDARSVDHLRRINTSAARLDALINDVLTYSRLLRSEMVLTPVNLDDVVRQVIATYPQLQANDAQITVVGTLPNVLANEASLTQCISNLLSNAVKFVAPGTVASVRVHADEIEGDCQLWIEDNGIGIDEGDQQRIWNIFTRIGRAKDYAGTGIGLAIVRKAVERMNGTIGIVSALGQGSKFWIRLRKD